MGLAEKRAIKNFEDNHFENLKKTINEAVGYDLPVEVKWSELAEDGMSHLYEEAFTKVYFEPVITAFKEICADDMGKEATKALIKKIVFVNTNAFSNPTGITLANGELRIDHKPTTNMGDVAERVKAIVNRIEEAA